MLKVELLAPLASDVVTSISGFTESTRDGRLYNAAAVYHRGAVIGIYRKLFPATRRSVYEAGNKTPVFDVDGLKFGIVICRDSNYFEPARIMAAPGATALFVPTNNDGAGGMYRPMPQSLRSTPDCCGLRNVSGVSKYDLNY